MAKHFGLDALLLERLRGNEFAFEFLAPKPVVVRPPRISFEEACERLKKFYIEAGRWPTKTASNPEDKINGNWLNKQRTANTAGTLSAERITALNAISPTWCQTPQDLWNQKCGVLGDIWRNTGRWPSTKASNPEEKTNGVWINTQRTHYNARTLSAERMTALNTISPTWCQTPEDLWNQKCGVLGDIWRNIGRWPSEKASNPEERTNGKWLNKQRTAHNAGTLSAERITALNAISPTWHTARPKQTAPKSA